MFFAVPFNLKHCYESFWGFAFRPPPQLCSWIPFQTPSLPNPGKNLAGVHRGGISDSSTTSFFSISHIKVRNHLRGVLKYRNVTNITTIHSVG